MTAVPALSLERRRLRLPRVDARLAIGLALVAVSVLGGLRLAAAADHTVGVLVAARDLPGNHVISRGDLRTTRVHASDEVLDTLVRANRVGALRGGVVLFPLTAGALLPRAALASSPTLGREITIPITPEHALGGKVRVGDRVDVLGSFTKSTKDARTLTVAHDAHVVELIRSEDLFGQREGRLSALTVSVPADEAVFVAFAIRNAELDVVRTTGGRPASRQSFDGSQLH